MINNSRFDLIPSVFSENFSMKEKYTDAIQLKMFITANCTNVSLLERVLKLLIKMIKSHPDEILRTKEQIWLLVIQMMFGLTQHKELHRKRYCRRYLIVKTVSLVREILKYVSMKEVVEGILRFNSSIKFRAVRQLINDVFWDKRAEFDLSSAAKSISLKVLREYENEEITVKGDGLAFKYTRCDICGLNVSKTSLHAVNTFGRFGQREDMNLVIFDCSRENYFNHAFHERCLGKHIKEELRKDKKASLQKIDLAKLARCVVCYRNNQEIRELGAQPTARRIGAARQSRAMTPNSRQAQDQSDSSETKSQSS